jgi:hypothetical protein
MNNDYNWKILINDGFCTYDYRITGRDDVSSLDIANMIAMYLDGHVNKSTEVVNEI